jgi:hypothetical protein
MDVIIGTRRVRTALGHVVPASDASQFYENIEDDRPFAILHDLPGMYGAFDRIRSLADGDALVVAGHDPEVLDRYRPPSESLAGLVAVSRENFLSCHDRR